MQNNSTHFIHVNINRIPAYHLTDKEKCNPYLVFEEQFDVISLNAFRELLWKSFLSTVTGSYNDQLSYKEREDVIFVYERIKKLIDAAYIINENVKLRELYIQNQLDREEEKEIEKDYSEAYYDSNQFRL